MEKILSILKQAREAERQLSVQQEHIERLHRIAAMAGRSLSYTQHIAEKLAKLERQLNDSIDRAADIKLAALKYIDQLHGDERAVMESYYLLGKTWEQIALKLYMSDRRVYLMRKKALKTLEKQIQEEQYERDRDHDKAC